VQSNDGALDLGAANVTSGGTAVLEIGALLPTGTDSVTAAYSGNTAFMTSTSTAFIETVDPLNVTTTTLVAAPSSATAGQSVTLAATVSLGSVTIDVSGVAVLALTTLPAGVDSLTAAYSGNTGFATSISSSLNETWLSTLTLSKMLIEQESNAPVRAPVE
jgi:hypothetical protein